MSSNFRLFPDGRSSVSGIIVDISGERQIVNFRGLYPETADWLPLEAVARASSVLADPRWVEGAATLFREARARQFRRCSTATWPMLRYSRRLLP